MDVFRIVYDIFTDTRLVLVILLAIAAAFADTLIAIAVALRKHDFDPDKLAMFLGDHVLARVIPVTAAAFFASSFEHVVQAGTESIPTAITVLVEAAWVLAWGGLAFYATETMRSIQSNVQRSPEPPTT